MKFISVKHKNGHKSSLAVEETNPGYFEVIGVLPHCAKIKLDGYPTSLIVAAPELLAACQSMDECWHILHAALKFIDNERIRNRAITILNDLQDGARSAVAKAKEKN